MHTKPLELQKPWKITKKDLDLSAGCKAFPKLLRLKKNLVYHFYFIWAYYLDFITSYFEAALVWPCQLSAH